MIGSKTITYRALQGLKIAPTEDAAPRPRKPDNPEADKLLHACLNCTLPAEKCKGEHSCAVLRRAESNN